MDDNTNPRASGIQNIRYCEARSLRAHISTVWVDEFVVFETESLPWASFGITDVVWSSLGLSEGS